MTMTDSTTNKTITSYSKTSESHHQSFGKYWAAVSGTKVITLIQSFLTPSVIKHEKQYLLLASWQRVKYKCVMVKKYLLSVLIGIKMSKVRPQIEKKRSTFFHPLLSNRFIFYKSYNFLDFRHKWVGRVLIANKALFKGLFLCLEIRMRISRYI